MNKFIALFSICLASLTFAQKGLAVKVGLQTTGILGAKIGDNKNGFGFYAGLSNSFKLDKTFSFQPELLYSYQTFNNVNVSINELIGGIETEENLRARFDYEYKTHFIKLPLLLKYQPKDIYIEIGPELAYNLSSRVNSEDKFNELPDIEGKVYNTNDFQLALLVGSGYQFNNNISAGLRAGFVFTKFIENSYIKNFNVSFGISYKIK